MKLCDLHNHVLPGVDDGAPHMATALQMLQNAVASDVAVLAVTPHCGRYYGNYLDEQLQARFAQLQQAAAELPLKLVLGGEALADDRFLSQLRLGKIPTLNGSRYVLTEFPADASAEFCTQLLQDVLQLGYVPLVAHPERYGAVCADPAMVLPWLEMGCHLQLTGGSILGEYGKKVQRTAGFLLQNDLVACIASDAHGLHRRSNFLLEVVDHLTVHYHKQYAQCLMYENPLRILRDEAI